MEAGLPSLVPLSASLGVRPTRAGVFVPSVNDLSWQNMFTGALSALTRFWGGSQNLVFSITEDLAEHELFWALVDLHDADQFLIYSGSIAELELLAPEWYVAARAREEERIAGFDPQVIDHHMEDWRGLWIVEGEVPEGLDELLVRRVAPLHGAALHALAPFGGLEQPPYPFSDVGKFEELTQALTNPSTPLGDTERLLLAAEVGILPPGLRDHLEERGVGIADEVLDTPAAWRQFLFRPARPAATYPLHLTEHGLNWYRRRPLRPEAVPVVVGEDPWDFSLFYALRRFRSLAYWIPTALLESEEYCRNILANAELHWGAPAIAVLTASDVNLRDEAVNRLGGLQQRMGGRAARPELRGEDWRGFLREEPNRLFERDNYGLSQPLLVSAGQTPPLSTPLPRASTETPTDLRWMTNVSLQGWSAMRNRHLGPRILQAGAYDENNLRCGADGPGYHCPHFFIQGGVSLEAATVRPVMRPLDILQQLSAIVEVQNWSVRPSDKGVYTRETVALFGGIPTLAADLRAADARLLLDTYLRRGDDQDAPGRWLSDDRRRYLSLTDLGALLDEDRAAALLADLEPRGVLRRGVILKCRRCRAAGFYSAADFEPTFRCFRCRLDQAPGRWSWFSTIEPVWYYRLDEVVRQFLTHNGDLPLLAAHDRFGTSVDAVSYAFELELVDQDSVASELDLAVLEGARLWIGEATVRDRLETSRADEQARLSRLAQIANLADAYGVILVTSAESFSARTKALAEAALPPLWPRLEIIEGVVVR